MISSILRVWLFLNPLFANQNLHNLRHCRFRSIDFLCQFLHGHAATLSIEGHHQHAMDSLYPIQSFQCQFRFNHVLQNIMRSIYSQHRFADLHVLPSIRTYYIERFYIVNYRQSPIVFNKSFNVILLNHTYSIDDLGMENIFFQIISHE